MFVPVGPLAALPRCKPASHTSPSGSTWRWPGREGAELGQGVGGWGHGEDVPLPWMSGISSTGVPHQTLERESLGSRGGSEPGLPG